jgi:hypothetical protein
LKSKFGIGIGIFQKKLLTSKFYRCVTFVVCLCVSASLRENACINPSEKKWDGCGCQKKKNVLKQKTNTKKMWNLLKNSKPQVGVLGLTSKLFLLQSQPQKKVKFQCFCGHLSFLNRHCGLSLWHSLTLISFDLVFYAGDLSWSFLISMFWCRCPLTLNLR